MKLKEKGVLAESDVYFYSGNLQSYDYFYHIICTGHYYCNGQYTVRRNSLDSFLLMYVISGSGYVVLNNTRHTIKEGQLALLNCYERPSYGTESGYEIMWIHFDGLNIGSLYKALNQKIITIADTKGIERAFTKIIEPFTKDSQPSDAIINKYITYLLTEFFHSDSDQLDDAYENKFQKVFNYINRNLDKKDDITIEKLAKISNLSVFYFIRAFKEETGYTPHDYIIRTRINTAIFFLRATDLSLTDITYKCGFSSESAFNNTFKRITGYTPLSYRKAILKERITGK